MIKKIPQVHQFLQPKLLRSHYGQSASESDGALCWCAQMQGLLPWTGSFSLMKSDRQSRGFHRHNCTNMYFNSSLNCWRQSKRSLPQLQPNSWLLEHRESSDDGSESNHGDNPCTSVLWENNSL